MDKMPARMTEDEKAAVLEFAEKEYVPGHKNYHFPAEGCAVVRFHNELDQCCEVPTEQVIAALEKAGNTVEDKGKEHAERRKKAEAEAKARADAEEKKAKAAQQATAAPK